MHMSQNDIWGIYYFFSKELFATNGREQISSEMIKNITYNEKWIYALAYLFSPYFDNFIFKIS